MAAAPLLAERTYFVNGRQVPAEAQEARELVAHAMASPSSSSTENRLQQELRSTLEKKLGTSSDGIPRRLVLFDGMCRLCFGFLAVVVPRDSLDRFRFAPLQSKLGQQVLAWKGLPLDIDSVVLIRDNEVFVRSSAALNILGELDGVASALSYLTIIPRPLRDFGYEMVAKSRYVMLGHATEAQKSKQEITARMVDTWEADPDDPSHVCKS
eukprot:CAMPEP_0170615154 /NCGR_PEP_ID=MMETSP0224-20130122/25184_1 /TAXON_ID=285029 /ORGANISM="Togula jolla, Strain CCCM 725" /LENGTH=210 /DNA_ID=CAMNT_0010940863 /DNA_START=50 /DNA_END=682 /DNA_ORIENTATION=-